MRRCYRIISRIFLSMLGGFILLFLIESFTRNSINETFQWVSSCDGIVWLNLLFCAGLSTLLFILPRVWMRCIAFHLLALLFSVLGFINRYKILYRFEPILLTDIAELGTVFTTVSKLDFSIDITQLANFALVVLLICVSVCFLSMKIKTGVSLPMTGFGIILCLSVFFLSTFELAGSADRFDLIDQCQKQGTLYTLFAVENHRRSQKNVTDTEEEIRTAYQTAVQTASSGKIADEQPNIILILQESYADENWLSNYVKLKDEVTPFYSSLQNTCRTGKIFVPKIGGGTSETEFEVLTGIASVWGFNPYCLSLPAINSLSSVLSRKGYETTCLHWYHGGYYNRYKNLGMLGFHQYYTTDTTNINCQSIGMFNSDADHYRAALEMLQSTPQKDFLFLITIQNHGGYTYADLGFPKDYEGEYSEETDLVLRNYIGLIHRSDEALSAFLSELSALEEETWVIGFSDHLPPFGSTVYTELGIDITNQDSHLVPYFLWCNRQEKNISLRSDMYAYELGAYALETAGLLDDPFLSYVNLIRKESSETLSENRRGDNQYLVLCRDILFGNQYSYQEGNIQVPQNLQTGGMLSEAEIVFSQEDDGVLKAELKTFPWSSKAVLYVNGTARSSGLISTEDFPADLQFRLLYAGRPLNESVVWHFESLDECIK